jgi:hypothetical protein
LYHLLTLGASVSPVAIHDKGNVPRDWTRSEHAKQDTLDAIESFIPKPVCWLQKRGNPLVRDDGSFSSVVVCCATHSSY